MLCLCWTDCCLLHPLLFGDKNTDLRKERKGVVLECELKGGGMDIEVLSDVSPGKDCSCVHSDLKTAVLSPSSSHRVALRSFSF